MDKISILGLGKLGLSLAGVIASKNFFVKGYDIKKVNSLMFEKGKAPFYETGLSKLLKNNKNKFSGHLNIFDCIKDTNVTFVVTPTPSLKNGSFDLKYTKKCFEELGLAIKKQGLYHTIILVSTVLPGSTRSVLIKSIELKTGLKINKDYGVCYSPAFIALGSIIQDFLNPDFVLLGHSNNLSKKIFIKIYEKVLKKPIFKIMSIENAELAKIALNSYVTSKITFANMLSKVAERLPGGDIDLITDAIGSDQRINKKYLTAGIGYGGPCFPRDNYALNYIASKLGVFMPISKITHDFNEKIYSNILKKYKSFFNKKVTVAVLGISYKSKSSCIEYSQGFFIEKKISKKVKKVYCHDVLAKKIEKYHFKNNMILTDDLKNTLKNSDIVIICNIEKIYSSINFVNLQNKKVIDFWRVLKVKKNNMLKNYYPIGKSQNKDFRELEHIWRQYI